MLKARKEKEPTARQKRTLNTKKGKSEDKDESEKTRASDIEGEKNKTNVTVRRYETIRML